MRIKDKKIKLLAVALAIFSLLTMLVWFDREKEKEKEADFATFSGPGFCPERVLNSELDASTIFLLDYSDPITDEDMGSIKDNVNNSIKKMGEKEKLSVLFVSEKPYEEVLLICKPPLPPRRCREADSGFREENWQCDAIETYGMCKEEKEKLKRFCKYEKRVDDLENKLEELSNKGLSMSPLIEGLSKISKRSDFSDRIPRRQLVMFSDLLQHTDSYSFYPNRGRFPEAEFVMEKENIKLPSVTVNVYLIERKRPPVQYSIVEKFWRDFFKLAGAESPTILPIPQAPDTPKTEPVSF